MKIVEEEVGVVEVVVAVAAVEVVLEVVEGEGVGDVVGLVVEVGVVELGTLEREEVA